MDRRALQHALENFTYTCSAQLQDLELGERFVGVFARQIWCYDPVKKLLESTSLFASIALVKTLLVNMVRDIQCVLIALLLKRKPFKGLHFELLVMTSSLMA